MILQAMTVVAGMAIVVQCVCALNHMSIHTRNSVRAAYLTLLLCAAAETMSPLYDTQTSASDSFLLVAVAVYIGVNHRRAYMVPR